MAELIKKGQPEDTEPLAPEEIDSEVDVKAVVWSAVVLGGITVLSFVLMWFLYRGLLSFEEGRDPAPSALGEAAEQPMPPEPRLQAIPEVELGTVEAEERMMLDGWALLDETYARIPIERAMEIVAASGGTPATERAVAATGEELGSVALEPQIDERPEVVPGEGDAGVEPGDEGMVGEGEEVSTDGGDGSPEPAAASPPPSDRGSNV